MHIRQQIIEDRVEETTDKLFLDKSTRNCRDIAFLRLAHHIVTGISIYEFNEADIVDGGQDKQIDVISIVQHSEDEAKIYIIQAKNTNSFSSNVLMQMQVGLNWLFNKSREDLDALLNVRLRDQIKEYRAIQRQFGTSNISVTVVFATNGLTSEISDEFWEEAKTIRDRYDNNTFANFEFLPLGADELVERLNISEKRNKTINEEIKIIYDVNKPSLVWHQAGDLKGVICTTSANEIARIVNSDPSGYIFDLNLRQFLGDKGSINSDILDTCSDNDKSYQFWFLNNGITVVCDRFDVDHSDGYLKVTNMQIVNGCQTASTLAQAARQNNLNNNVSVLLRVYETRMDTAIAEKIVVTTNNQNKISSRDLKANDPIQMDIEQGFASYSYFYERKVNQYSKRPEINAKNIATNFLVGQCYLAVVLRIPSDARSRQYKVWGVLYRNIFDGNLVEPYIISWLLYQYTKEFLSKYRNDSNSLRRKLANTGIFHVARVTAYLWRGGDYWKNTKKDMRPQFQHEISLIQNEPASLDGVMTQALEILEQVINHHEEYRDDLENALKSYQLDDKINAMLYKEYS
jgi:hypothetical protein